MSELIAIGIPRGKLTAEPTLSDFYIFRMFPSDTKDTTLRFLLSRFKCDIKEHVFSTKVDNPFNGGEQITVYHVSTTGFVHHQLDDGLEAITVDAHYTGMLGVPHFPNPMYMHDVLITGPRWNAYNDNLTDTTDLITDAFLYIGPPVESSDDYELEYMVHVGELHREYGQEVINFTHTDACEAYKIFSRNGLMSPGKIVKLVTDPARHVLVVELSPDYTKTVLVNLGVKYVRMPAAIVALFAEGYQIDDDSCHNFLNVAFEEEGPRVVCKGNEVIEL